MRYINDAPPIHFIHRPSPKVYSLMVDFNLGLGNVTTGYPHVRNIYNFMDKARAYKALDLLNKRFKSPDIYNAQKICCRIDFTQFLKYDDVENTRLHINREEDEAYAADLIWHNLERYHYAKQ